MNEKQLQLCSFEQAKALKQLGFDWETELCYNFSFNKESAMLFTVGMASYEIGSGMVSKCNANKWGEFYSSAPTVALALKWMRDVKGIRNGVCDTPNIYYGDYCEPNRNSRPATLNFDTYEQAESALLDELIKLCEEGATDYCHIKENWDIKPTLEQAWESPKNMFCYIKNTCNITKLTHHYAFDGECYFILEDEGNVEYYAPTCRDYDVNKLFECFLFNKEYWMKMTEEEFKNTLSKGLFV